jgi:hypothetical protein
MLDFFRFRRYEEYGSMDPRTGSGNFVLANLPILAMVTKD